jgi:L-asparaginase
MQIDNNVLIVNTGGTFNKIYDPIKGKLLVDNSSKSLNELASKWLCKFEVVNILGKDSLELNNDDREIILNTINKSSYNKIIVVHGTDTMDLTAKYLNSKKLEKKVVLTGAMVPYFIDPVEASANLASSLGYLQNLNHNGIFIVLNGVFGEHFNIIKDRKNGRFIIR